MIKLLIPFYAKGQPLSDIYSRKIGKISYLPDRLLELKYKGDGHFLVKESYIGDELMVSHIVKGYPLLVSHVWRDGADLGSFTAGKSQGISFNIV
jgi:hypothetical protein